MAAAKSEYVEGVVCKFTDVKENTMKEFSLAGSGTVLMVKQEGKMYALAPRCTHYDAPMVDGALGKGCVRCPWHGARFDIKTGDIEDYPGLDSLPSFQVTVTNGNVKVRAKKSELQSSRHVKAFSPKVPWDCNTAVIIGGGPSAAVCVETLRQNDFTGRIIMICGENALPYDRVIVSKYLKETVNNIQFRNDKFYSDKSINVYKGKKVMKVDVADKRIILDDCENIGFSMLYIATGVRPRPLNVKGSKLKNIFYLRTIQDANSVDRELNSNTNVVILGSSFIGMEAAHYCIGKAKSVTVIGRDSVPFEKVFGAAVGGRVKRLFEENKIRFKMNNGIKECIGQNGKIVQVKLNDNTFIPANVLIAGIGSIYNTEFLKESGINVDADGSIPVDERMQTNVKGIYAGGDVAKAPVFSHDGIKAAIGHFGLSEFHGKTAALNMAGIDTPLKSVPFFWTRSFERSIIYCGHGRFKETKLIGDLEKMEFAVYYMDEGGKVIAMAACHFGSIVSQYAELLAQGKQLYGSELTEDPQDWIRRVLAR